MGFGREATSRADAAWALPIAAVAATAAGKSVA
jgi:hypothetical protein